MAKYQWTGAGETAGSAPTLFTNVWGGSLSEWEVQTNATAEKDGKVLALVGTTSVRRALALTAAGTATGRIESRGRMYHDGSGVAFHFVKMLISGAAGNETNVHVDYITQDGWRIAQYAAGSYSTTGKSNVTAAAGWYRFRLLASINGTVELWVWGDNDAEPATPIATSNTGLPYGGVGLGAFSAQQSLIDWISFGTAGDDAADLQGTGGPSVVAPSNAPSIGTPSATSSSVTSSFTFSTASNTGDAVTGYEVRLNGGVWQALGIPNPLAFTINGLTSETTYNAPGLEIRAINSGGAGPVSASQTFTTAVAPNATPLIAPTNLAVSEITQTSALLSWERGV